LAFTDYPARCVPPSKVSFTFDNKNRCDAIFALCNLFGFWVVNFKEIQPSEDVQLWRGAGWVIKKWGIKYIDFLRLGAVLRIGMPSRTQTGIDVLNEKFKF
jgi:hypothetical protein